MVLIQLSKLLINALHVAIMPGHMQVYRYLTGNNLVYNVPKRTWTENSIYPRPYTVGKCSLRKQVKKVN